MNSSSPPVAVVCPRGSVAFILFVFFCLAYLVTPYWHISSSPEVRILLLLVTVLLAAVWAHFSAADVHFQESRGWILDLLFCLVIMGVMNHRTLNAGIPWRGDEDYHIMVVRSLIGKPDLLLAGFFLAVLFIISVLRGSRWRLPAALLLIVYGVFWGLALNPPASSTILRYPFISRYLEAIPPAIAAYFRISDYEIPYRITPFLFSVIVVWCCCRQVGLSNPWERMALGAAVCSLPIVYYYSSILYLEMPAIALMMMAAADMKALLADDFRDIRRKPQWLALILIGFIKETVAAFLLAYLCCRFATRLISGRWKGLVPGHSWSRRFLWDEICIQLCVLLPALTYLFYRATFGASRRFEPSLASLFDIHIYSAFLQSLWEQFGLFAFFPILGIVLLIRRKAFPVVGFLLVAFFLTFILIATDHAAYVGYSRFNLLFFPIILIPALESIRFLFQKRRKLAILLICATLLFNILKSPINADGTKKPLWGNLLCDTSEHYYPYREALHWLKTERESTTILFSGLYYSYYVAFYFDQLAWNPPNAVQFSAKKDEPARTLRKAFESAYQNRYDTIVYQVSDEGAIVEKGEYGYVLKKVFRNQAHVLAVYGSW